jgi:hypothetical protein
MMMVSNSWLKVITIGTLGLTVTGSLSLLSVWSILRTLKQGVSHLKRLHQIPCCRCQYFTGDYRLKCPVQPLIACTEESINCRDFTLIPCAKTCAETSLLDTKQESFRFQRAFQTTL